MLQVASALTNPISAATSKRIRSLPVRYQRSKPAA